MGSSKKYLAFDLGAESGRSIVGTFDGDRLALQEIHRFPNTAVRRGGSIGCVAFGLIGIPTPVLAW